MGWETIPDAIRDRAGEGSWLLRQAIAPAKLEIRQIVGAMVTSSAGAPGSRERKGDRCVSGCE